MKNDSLECLPWSDHYTPAKSIAANHVANAFIAADGKLKFGKFFRSSNDANYEIVDF